MSSPNTAGISKELLNGTAKESDSSKKEGHEKVPEGKTGTNSDAAMLDASKLEFMESIGEDVEDLEKKICQWRWHCIDGVRLPVILRDGNSRLASVNIVQTKLLSKFPQNIPLNIAEEHVMLSHKMTATEALTLNVLNSALSSYELGCQIFTTDDEVTLFSTIRALYICNCCSNSACRHSTSGNLLLDSEETPPEQPHYHIQRCPEKRQPCQQTDRTDDRMPRATSR